MGGLRKWKPCVEPTADSRSGHGCLRWQSRMAVLWFFFFSSDRAVTMVSGQLPNSAWGHMLRQGECLCQFGGGRRVCEKTASRRQVCTRRESADVHAQTGLNAIGMYRGASAEKEK